MTTIEIMAFSQTTWEAYRNFCNDNRIDCIEGTLIWSDVHERLKKGDTSRPKILIEKASTNPIDEKVLWAIIEKANWWKDHDYKRIAGEFQKLPKDVFKMLDEFITLKVRELSNRFEKDWLGDPGISVSDDGWMDLTGEVVGRGEKFYKEITVKKLQIMADDHDYRESFTYCLQ